MIDVKKLNNDSESLQKNYNEYVLAIKKLESNICEFQKVQIWHASESERMYSENIRHYKNFITSVRYLIKEISLIDNAISYSIATSLLVNSGSLSCNNSFKLTTDKSKLIDMSGYFGIDIINGNGSCRHISSIHNDIFRSLGIYSILMPVFETTEDISLYESFSRRQNHFVNIYFYNGSYYIFDAANNIFFEMKNAFESIGKSDDEQYKLFNKFDEYMILKNVSYDEFISIINSISNNLGKNISQKEIIEIAYETCNLFKTNYNLVSDFKNETMDCKKKILKNLNPKINN